MARRDTSERASTHIGERPLVIGLVIFLLLLVASSFTDHRAYLSTDTGGKTVTLESMVRDGDYSLDIGYWAEDLDPDGSLNPYFGTNRVGDKWIQVTTIPMIIASRPLYDFAGYSGAILLPMLGVVLTALGAGALHRELGHATGAPAAWAVGLAGPAFVYGLDLWEHSLGLALMVWGAVFMIRAIDPASPLRLPYASGLAFGLAATMRQEALIYGFVAGLIVAWNRRDKIASVLAGGAMMVLGVLGPLVLNTMAERSLIGQAQRSGRAAGAVSGGGSDLGQRVSETLLEVAGPMPGFELALVPVYLCFLVGLAWLGWSISREEDLRKPVILVGLGYLVLLASVLAQGIGFVPGLLVVSPLAGLAILAGGGSPASTQLRVLALSAVPLVGYFQYGGGAGPQWGGRYLLGTTVILSVVGIDLAARHQPKVLKALLGVAAGLSLVSVMWLAERSHGFADATSEIAAIDQPVTVFWDPFFAREAGPLMLDDQWLTATNEEQRTEVADLLTDLGVDSFAYVTGPIEDDQTFEGFFASDHSEVELLSGIYLTVVTYSR